MTVSAAASDRHGTTAASGIDRAIRLSTAAAVLAVAGIAAYVSYGHAYAVARAHGESGITARLEPATIDGLVYASSMVVLYAARQRCRYPAWPAGCPGWGSRPPSPRTWPRAGPTASSGRWSRPGPRSASWAHISSWSGSSASPGLPDPGRRQSICLKVRSAVAHAENSSAQVRAAICGSRRLACIGCSPAVPSAAA